MSGLAEFLRDDMADLLDAEYERCYRMHGIAFPIPVLSAEEVDHYRDASEELERRLGGRPKTVEVRQMHLHFRWAYELATHPRVLDAVEGVLGPNLLIWATELFAKHPNDPAVAVGWHRDGPYMGLDPESTVTAWIALTSSTGENGCMCFAVEPSRNGQSGWGPRLRQQATDCSRPPADVPQEIANVELEAGEMSLHDAYILHGSGPNLSGTKRVGFAVRFTTPRSRPTVNGTPAILARGNDPYGHFHLLDPPRETDTEEALVGLRHSARRHLEATLQNLKHAAR